MKLTDVELLAIGLDKEIVNGLIAAGKVAKAKGKARIIQYVNGEKLELCVSIPSMKINVSADSLSELMKLLEESAERIKNGEVDEIKPRRYKVAAE